MGTYKKVFSNVCIHSIDMRREHCIVCTIVYQEMATLLIIISLLTCFIVACTWIKFDYQNDTHELCAAQRIVHAKILCSHFVHNCDVQRFLFSFWLDLLQFGGQCYQVYASHLDPSRLLNNPHVVGAKK